ncbi:hypothetical protein [Trichococcus shcherbakoviae]|uniref:hypothetical protein n=1 Tax=Trichococcus shcherbakoviae TaxID=2094020 RepID=UPI002AA953E2|nr:hypothetical protein [Trichococcus shcherbakoviae]
MAIFALPAGSTYYAAIWGFDGTRWNGSAMVAPSAIANIDWETGMVPLVSLSTSSSSATGMFTFTAPALPAGFYFLTIHTINTFEVESNAIASMKLAWNGVAEVQELPAAAAGASGGVLIVGTGSGAVNPSGGKVPATVANGDLDQAVTLAASQPNYSPAKAEDKMDLINAPNATAIMAIQSGLSKPGTAQTIAENQNVNVNQWGGLSLPAIGTSTLTTSDVQSAMASQGYTTTRAGYLDVLNGIVAAVASAVWSATTRTLSAFGFSVGVSDKTGFSLVPAYDAAKAAASSAELTAVQTHGDSAWATATGFSTLDADGVRAELATELGRIDAAVSSRATPTNVTDARDHVESHGDTAWATATGFATPGDLAAIGLVCTHLGTMLEVDGTVYRLTTNALENAPTGSGGSSTVVVSPVSISVSPGQASAHAALLAYQYAKLNYSLTIRDTAGTAVNLTGKSLRMQFFSQNDSANELFSIVTGGTAGDRLVVGGVDGNSVAVEGPATITAIARQMAWRLFDVTDMRVVGSGTIKIEPGPSPEDDETT